MICESITVTNTITSVAALIGTARSATAGDMHKTGDLSLTYPVAASIEILGKDADSVGHMTLLQGATEGRNFIQLKHVNIDELKLITSSSTQAVDIMFENGNIS